MKSMIAAFLFLTSAAAFAGDTDVLVPVGFSPKGSYYAFIQDGVGDGSGAAYSKLSIVSVAKNALLFQAKFDEASSNGADEFQGDVAAADKKVLAASKQALKKYSITPFKILGRDLLVRVPSDLTEGPAKFQYAEYLGGLPYEIQVTGTKIASPKDYCDVNPELLTATLVSYPDTDGPGVNLVLQKDSVLPESRECAYGYSVTRVTVYKKSLVSMISYFSVGFEGPDESAIAVTAIYDFDKEN